MKRCPKSKIYYIVKSEPEKKESEKSKARNKKKNFNNNG